MTELADFSRQYEHVLNRVVAEAGLPVEQLEIFLLTLPYYSAVGYLFDSEDLEFYLQKVNPGYQVPPTFKRVTPPGQPITDPLRGDRVSLLTFCFMYALLDSDYPVEYVNGILEENGVQQDGLVLSEAEQQVIMARIDSFNQAITATAAANPHVHHLDIGGFLNQGLGGQTPIVVSGRTLSRKWSRGRTFSLDGVHPGYTGQAVVANYLLERLNAIFGWNAPPPLHDLATVMAQDPYQDEDGDGWVPGPGYPPHGFTEILFMLTDPDDQDPSAEMILPMDFWDRISAILLQELLEKDRLAELARKHGIATTPR